MDDDAPKENPTADFNKLDLSQLHGFSFGTQWTQDKGSHSDAHSRGERPQRDERGDGPAHAPDRRDRRAFRRPLSDAPGAAARDGSPVRRAEPGDRGPRRDPGEYRGGLRREGPAGDRPERGPYDSPYFAAVFYPEDSSFNALVKTIRSSARTIELFEIARTVVGKPDRFVVVVGRKTAAAAAAAPGAPPAPIYISVPDGLPFESEEAAIAHVLSRHLSGFFAAEEIEVEPPKGNFQVVNRCGVTGELLGPPNYHRYTQIMQQHHAAKVARMPFEAFRSRIETVREPEAIAQWLEKMKKVVRYTLKPEVEGGPAGVSFDGLEEARAHLLSHARDKVVRAAESARFHGKAIESLPAGEIRRAIEGALERQIRFPLDTANVLRGRLRREHFTIFKKGSKGISYVCAVKRKFRIPGQAFAESIGSVISFIEANPLIKAAELPSKFLGIEAPADGAGPSQADREKIARMQGDLVWLVREGYVTEFIDGGLYAAPPVAEARKREAEAEELDPESFPESPAATPAEEGVPSAQAEPGAPPGSSAESAPSPVAGVTAREEVPPPIENAAPVENAAPAESPPVA